MSFGHLDKECFDHSLNPVFGGDLHRKGTQPAGHRLIAGKLTYADPFWEVIEITNTEGNQTFAMDEATGSKLSMLKKGNLVRAELNEDNMVVDIGPTRVDE